MNKERIKKITDSIDRLELNLKLSLEEISLIRKELNDINDGESINNFTGLDFDKLIKDIDQQIEYLENNMRTEDKSEKKLDEDEIENKVIQLRSEKNNNYEKNLNPVDEEIYRYNYERIGLQNYVDSKKIVRIVMDRSKEIAKDIDEKKNKMLLTMEEGKNLEIKNKNLKTYKEFFNNKLKDLKRKKTEYVKAILNLSTINIADEDKKYLIEEGTDNLLRFLSFLMLDSYSKDAVNYYNVGRFYCNYEEMKMMLFIDEDKKDDFDSCLEDLLAVSYQANIMRYDVKFANNEIVENKRISATLRNK